jgi:hypothetical protein
MKIVTILIVFLCAWSAAATGSDYIGIYLDENMTECGTDLGVDYLSPTFYVMAIFEHVPSWIDFTLTITCNGAGLHIRTDRQTPRPPCWYYTNPLDNPVYGVSMNLLWRNECQYDEELLYSPNEWVTLLKFQYNHGDYDGAPCWIILGSNTSQQPQYWSSEPQYSEEGIALRVLNSGAINEDCDVFMATETTSWGAIKSMYR